MKMSELRDEDIEAGNKTKRKRRRDDEKRCKCCGGPIDVELACFQREAFCQGCMNTSRPAFEMKYGSDDEE